MGSVFLSMSSTPIENHFTQLMGALNGRGSMDTPVLRMYATTHTCRHGLDSATHPSSGVPVYTESPAAHREVNTLYPRSKTILHLCGGFRCKARFQGESRCTATASQCVIPMSLKICSTVAGMPFTPTAAAPARVETHGVKIPRQS